MHIKTPSTVLWFGLGLELPVRAVYFLCSEATVLISISWQPTAGSPSPQLLRFLLSTPTDNLMVKVVISLSAYPRWVPARVLGYAGALCYRVPRPSYAVLYAGHPHLLPLSQKVSENGTGVCLSLSLPVLGQVPSLQCLAVSKMRLS